MYDINHKSDSIQNTYFSHFTICFSVCLVCLFESKAKVESVCF